MNEFEIIEQYFKQVHPQSQGDLVLGIGDDAAIVTVPEDSELLISMDTLVAGTHFPLETAPEDIAYKALAVNLSDMAAMGAFPRWVSLSLALPEDDADWLQRFSSSFNQFSSKESLVLIGGDITRAPLSVTIQIHGIAPRGKSLRRDGAGIGDLIYVTGKLGAAAYAYQKIISSDSFPSPTEEELQRFLRPEPRIETGIKLRSIATSCIDISDGLISDLNHILKASEVGAEIQLPSIPYADSLQKLDKDKAIELALTGGDDYELCFTLPDGVLEELVNELHTICPVHCIGTINKNNFKLDLMGDNDQIYTIQKTGYRHFN